MHEILTRAADGTLPEWAVVSPERREHVARVAALLGRWADALDLPAVDRTRWVASGTLHDALRDADPAELRERIPPALQELPGPLLHGPAAAERLRVDGVEDGELLRAVAFHTIGDPAFAALGRALYAADFLEPGRSFATEWRARLSDRMPDELDGVVFEIVGARLRHLVERGAPLRPRSVAFWNRLAEERR